MYRSFLIFLGIIALCTAQKLYIEDFSRLISYAKGMTQAKVKTFMTNANKEGWAAVQKRIKTFVNKNVAGTDDRYFANYELEYICKNVILSKNFMNSIYAAIKKSKVIADAKQKEIKKLYDDFDKNQAGHMLSWNYGSWIYAAQEKIPTDKWKTFNNTVATAEAAYKKKNKDNYEYIINFTPMLGK